MAAGASLRFCSFLETEVTLMFTRSSSEKSVVVAAVEFVVSAAALAIGLSRPARINPHRPPRTKLLTILLAFIFMESNGFEHFLKPVELVDLVENMVRLEFPVF